MIAVAGLTAADPHTGFRRDMCTFADERSWTTEKNRLHARGPASRRDRDAHASRPHRALCGLARPGAHGRRRRRPRHSLRSSATARRAIATSPLRATPTMASVQTRMMALARNLGWLTPAQEQAEFVHMLADRMARGSLGKNEVDLVCATPQQEDAGLAQQLLASGAARAGNVAHSAVLACLGNAEAHERTVRALTGCARRRSGDRAGLPAPAPARRRRPVACRDDGHRAHDRCRRASACARNAGATTGVRSAKSAGDRRPVCTGPLAGNCSARSRAS